jgi:osmotically-inducible protein OsmY
MCLQTIKSRFGNCHFYELQQQVTITVSDDGVVTLEGTVSTYYLKQSAQELVKQTCLECSCSCHMRVVNNIEVGGASASFFTKKPLE